MFLDPLEVNMAEDSSKKIKYVPMVLEKSQVPRGAIRVSQSDVIAMQQARIRRCKSISEISAFRFAPHILGASTALTAMSINSHFRLKFQLMNLGVMFSYGPVVVVPTLMTLLLNDFLSTKVLLQPECRECLQVRSGVFQVATSVLYSSVLAPLTSIILSRRNFTYANPRNRFEPNIYHALKTNAYVRGCLAALMAANFTLGAYVRYKQSQQLDSLMEKESHVDTKKILEEIRD
ncbi:uncharacterized protein LOC132725907 isoform X2 [Ruditapes philippinarum]|uniref:uncharacterized protein LOC132725907 isoform X2 n=1 Tax=Ruditapes philippinarum TaxID=129788 RepID=UPI00295BCDF8|nr:uncharacterized protein LOC132725907 isoform X2 [Ruditapes philippinarum]